MSRLKSIQDSEDGKSYRKGYEDGARDAFDHSELDAFYAGVGYGKKLSGDKHIGFKNDEERKRFEEGVQAKDKHFNSYRAEPMGFFEKILAFIFGVKESRKDHLKLKDKRTDKLKRVQKNWKGGKRSDNAVNYRFFRKKMKSNQRKIRSNKNKARRVGWKQQKKNLRNYK